MCVCVELIYQKLCQIMIRKQKVKKEKNNNWNPKWIVYLGFHITGVFFGFQKSLEKSQKRAPGKGKDHQHQQKREKESDAREEEEEEEEEERLFFVVLVFPCGSRGDEKRGGERVAHTARELEDKGR